jgi:hypothetical protein
MRRMPKCPNQTRFCPNTNIWMTCVSMCKMPKHKNSIGVEHKDKSSLRFCARPCIPPFLQQSQALPRTPHIILLDHSGTACISDIGLHHLFFSATASSSHDAYKAPVPRTHSQPKKQLHPEMRRLQLRGDFVGDFDGKNGNSGRGRNGFGEVGSSSTHVKRRVLYMGSA